MKVYGHPLSIYTRMVLMTLAEKGHSAELVVVDILAGENHGAEHLARQPWGQVPVFEEDGWQLYESRAICRYLDARLPEPALIPADPRERARMEQWISIETANFSPGAMKIIAQLLFSRYRGHEPDLAIVAEGRESVRRAVAVMERELASHDFISGDRFTLADSVFMPFIDYLAAAGELSLITEHAHTAAWWRRISERPTWQQVIGKAAGRTSGGAGRGAAAPPMPT